MIHIGYEGIDHCRKSVFFLNIPAQSTKKKPPILLFELLCLLYLLRKNFTRLILKLLNFWNITELCVKDNPIYQCGNNCDYPLPDFQSSANHETWSLFLIHKTEVGSLETVKQLANVTNITVCFLVMSKHFFT